MLSFKGSQIGCVPKYHKNVQLFLFFESLFFIRRKEKRENVEHFRDILGAILKYKWVGKRWEVQHPNGARYELHQCWNNTFHLALWITEYPFLLSFFSTPFLEGERKRERTINQGETYWFIFLLLWFFMYSAAHSSIESYFYIFGMIRIRRQIPSFVH